MTRWVRYFVILALFSLANCQDDDSQTNVKPGDFLSGSSFQSLVIEVVYVPGNQPTEHALNNLKVFLESRLNKPGGISVVETAVPSPGLTAVDVKQLQEAEKANRRQVTKGNVLTAYIFFVDGSYSLNATVLGVAYGTSSIAVFQNTIREFSGSVGRPSTRVMETLTLNHEFGHILGLVNNGTPQQSLHEDIAHNTHCNNARCLMHYSAEAGEVVLGLLGGVAPDLDANCIADLKANGGK